MDQSMTVMRHESTRATRSSGVRIEHLAARDRSRLIAHFLALPPQRLADRFGVMDLELSIRAYVDRLDFERNIVVALSEGGDMLFGTAEVLMFSMDAHWGELVFTTLNGTVPALSCERMIAAAIARAREAGMGLLVVNAAAFDSDTRALLARVGFDLVLHEGGIAGEMRLSEAAYDA